MNDRSAIVAARNVGRRDHGHHARHGADGVELHVLEPAIRRGRQAQRAVQRAGKFGDVVDVRGFAGDVQLGRLVRPADAHARAVTMCLRFGALVDARGGVGQVVGKGLGGLEQAGIEGFVHLRLLQCSFRAA